MRKRIISIVLITILYAVNVNAGNSPAVKVADKFKSYFSSTLQNVKNENNPALKRQIINNSLEKVDRVLKTVSEIPGVPASDIKALNTLRQNYKDKSNELNGLSGYTKVKDNQLNNFANYLMQSNEQADKYVVISITTLLLIIIIILLLTAL